MAYRTLEIGDYVKVRKIGDIECHGRFGEVVRQGTTPGWYGVRLTIWVGSEMQTVERDFSDEQLLSASYPVTQMVYDVVEEELDELEELGHSDLLHLVRTQRSEIARLKAEISRGY